MSEFHKSDSDKPVHSWYWRPSQSLTLAFFKWLRTSNRGSDTMNMHANIQKWCWLLQNYIVKMPLSDKSQGVYCPRRLSQGLYPARSWWGKKQESFVSENSTRCSSAALTVRHCWPWELISDNRYGHTHTHWVIQSHLIRATEIQIQNISRFTETVHFRSQRRGLILLVNLLVI